MKLIPVQVECYAGVKADETPRRFARQVDESPGQIAHDLNHLLRSLKHTDYKAVIEPARCRACGFELSDGKLNKPSKCPECHSTWVLEPKILIEWKN
jgi:predicted Zn-ribbon and HTH transcriptional regulator